ncbi:hypothetical protein [Metabacillus halosaccharovorans]|uniref:Uncharacterized protein n=1 Tax=Metabacillus halosaccharovorans TaxID=930124 RepID=A0ABT3DCV6_9BACI|nr:hypothetical protein [Metabacillus halosaccharovorans]MCV9884716.1 hypothetical protein [Metabacillus halosaccharovorans]
MFIKRKLLTSIITALIFTSLFPLVSLIVILPTIISSIITTFFGASWNGIHFDYSELPGLLFILSYILLCALIGNVCISTPVSIFTSYISKKNTLLSQRLYLLLFPLLFGILFIFSPVLAIFAAINLVLFYFLEELLKNKPNCFCRKLISL